MLYNICYIAYVMLCYIAYAKLCYITCYAMLLLRSDHQPNQDLREIYKGWRILEFITSYHNALHLTRVHSATNNSNKNMGKFASFAAQTQSFLCSKFSTARLEVLPNLRHARAFQMSTMVNLGIGFQFKRLRLVQVLNLTKRWAFALRLCNTGDIQIPAC